MIISGLIEDKDANKKKVFRILWVICVYRGKKTWKERKVADKGEVTVIITKYKRFEKCWHNHYWKLACQLQYFDVKRIVG